MTIRIRFSKPMEDKILDGLKHVLEFQQEIPKKLGDILFPIDDGVKVTIETM